MGLFQWSNVPFGRTTDNQQSTTDERRPAKEFRDWAQAPKAGKERKMDLIKKLEELRAQEQSLNWQGTFADYFEIVKANPQVAQLSHARIFDMITSIGVEEGKG